MEIQPSELAECSRWLLQRPLELLTPAYSIVVEINCPACQPSIAAGLAQYLNEFGDFPNLSWKAFDTPLLNRLATSPLANQLCHDGESVAHTLASMGGSILEGSGVVTETSNVPHTFQVCLACKEPESQPFHLHLNQKRFEPRKVVSVIADAFLEWVDGGGDPESFANHAQSLATDAKPPFA